MPRNQRYVLPGYAYHVTQRGTDRQNVFRQAGDRDVYVDLLRDQWQDAGMSVQTYCLMSNHVHLIVTPEQGDSLAVLFRRVHGRYAQYFNARYRRSGHLWHILSIFSGRKCGEIESRLIILAVNCFD